MRVDTGYQNIGVSAVITKAEIFNTEIEFSKKITKRIEERRKYRSNRRSRLRHREKRFSNAGNLLYGWEPELKSFKVQIFMSIVCWRMVNRLKGDFKEVEHTYGHLAKSKRVDLGLEKSHSNDAFVIAGGTTQKHNDTFKVKQIRRNNRSLDKFYNAKYLDLRDGKKKSDSELADQRCKRNTENNINFRVHRRHKIKKGGCCIRKKSYPFHPNDVVIYDGETINSNVQEVVPYCYGKGFCYL